MGDLGGGLCCEDCGEHLRCSDWTGAAFPEEEEEGRGAQRLLGGLSGAKHGDIKADFLPSEKAKIEAIAKAKKVVNPAPPPPQTYKRAHTHVANCFV